MAIAFAGPLSRFFGATMDEAVRLRAGVEAWRSDLRASVVEKVGGQLQWDEGADVAFASDLGEAGWMALRLFAFYAERSDLEWPDTVPALLELDLEWRKAADDRFSKSLYGQLLACDMWLPGEFPVTMRAPRPDGESAEIGSVKVLRDQLQWLNQRTFQADADVIVGWRTCAAPAGGEFLTAARRGYAGLTAAVDAALQHHVPIALRPL